MKMVKSLLLGSAAGFVAITGAQAADLPLAEPVEYVKICDTYGAGFFYIPGTDTCLKIGGYVRFDQRIDLGDETVFNDDGSITSDGFFGTPFDDGYSSRARASIRLDARTETEWGTLRSYIETHTQRTSDNSSLGDFGVDDAYIENAFIQFAGFTAGRTSSFYDFVVTETIADFFSDQQVNTFAYTASFGSGFTATVALEDKSDRTFGPGGTADVDVDGDGIIDVGSGIDGIVEQEFPNFVAALRVDQAWGAAQISGAIQDNEGDDFFGVSPDLGWAVQAGVQVNLPTSVEGSYVWVQGAFSEGAVAYGFLGDTLDIPVLVEDFSLVDGELSTLWAVGGGFNFQATEAVNIYGTAAFVRYEAGTLDGLAGNDFEFIQAAGGIGWEPVDNLVLKAEAQFVTVTFDDDFFGEDDFDDLRVFTRIQRNF